MALFIWGPHLRGHRTRRTAGRGTTTEEETTYDSQIPCGLKFKWEGFIFDMDLNCAQSPEEYAEVYREMVNNKFPGQFTVWLDRETRKINIYRVGTVEGS